MYFALKRSVITVEELDRYTTLHTIYGIEEGHRGDYIATDLEGNKKILSKSYFEEYFTPVSIPQKKSSTQQSPFEQEYAKALMECYGNDITDQSEDWSELEDSINDLNKAIKNKL